MLSIVRVLVANAGSSNLKLRVLGTDDALLASADLPSEAQRGAIEEFVATAPHFDALRHRVVHGGRELRGSVVVNEGVLERLRAVGDLARCTTRRRSPRFMCCCHCAPGSRT
jgi:acetate kinase